MQYQTAIVCSGHGSRWHQRNGPAATRNAMTTPLPGENLPEASFTVDGP